MANKIFVGNLNFNTSQDALRNFFSEVGTVKDVTIKRGYGFVEFETDDMALNAVQAKNKQELDGRPINIEVSRPPRAPRQDGGFRRGPPRRGPPRGDFFPQGERNFRPPRRSFNEDDGQRRTYGGPRFDGPPRRYDNNRPPRFEGGFDSRPPRFVNEGFDERPQRYDRPPRPRGPPQEGFDNRPPRPRGPPRPRRQPPANQPESATTLFVGNIPYRLTEEELRDAFKAFNPKIARIIKTKTGRSRGFGFVEFHDENSQKDALNKETNLQIQGRPVTVKVALAQQEQQEQQQQQQQQ